MFFILFITPFFILFSPKKSRKPQETVYAFRHKLWFQKLSNDSMGKIFLFVWRFMSRFDNTIRLIKIVGKVHKVQVQGEKSPEITLTSTTERKLSPIWPSSEFPKINEF